jgi:hypothetical protein
MKTKQLLEIALKVIGVFMLISALLALLFSAEAGLILLFTGGAGLGFTGVLFSLLYAAALYFVVFKTEIIVSWIYKEKENEADLNLSFNTPHLIFFAIVLACLYQLSFRIPNFVSTIIQYSFFDWITSKAMYQGAIQIAVLILVIKNASRITHWIEQYQQKQMPEKP